MRHRQFLAALLQQVQHPHEVTLPSPIFPSAADGSASPEGDEETAAACGRPWPSGVP